jgi:acyl carrier protein
VPPPDLPSAQESGLTDLVSLTRALAESGYGEGATVVALSNGVQRVTGEEELCPTKATLLGWVRTAPPAGLGPRRRSVDVVLPGPGGEEPERLARLCERLLAEIRSEAAEPVVAYRGGDRWIPVLEPAPLGPPRRPAAWRRPDGWYLVTGGLDGLAHATARWLAAAGPVRLALVVPPGYPEAGREGLLRELAESGAEVRIVEAVPADREALAAGLAHVEAAWGPPAGVFHLPGQLGPADWMESTLLLNTIFGRDRTVGFIVLFSWLEPPPGTRTHPEVWAASALLDALAHERAARGAAPTVAVDWAGGAGFDLQAAFSALDRILAHLAVPQIVVALPAAAQDREAAARPLPEGEGESLPDDPFSRRIAAIWRQTLGVERIGPRDRFFDLGGDSLIAVQVLARLRDAFPVELPVAALFERPTIPELRDALEEALTARLEELPEEEAERLVADLFD